MAARHTPTSPSRDFCQLRDVKQRIFTLKGVVRQHAVRSRVLTRAGIKPPSQVNAATLTMAPPATPEETPQWGPDTAEHVAEWRRQLDLKGWGAEMRSLERKLRAEQGPADVAHLQKILNFSNLFYFSGIALAGFCNPLGGNFVAAFLLSLGIYARWAMVGHHVSHGGYNQQQVDGRFHRKTFAKGPVNRVFDWLDWMLPEAWDVEHNNLHHYKLGEVDGDPDLVEKNLVDLREKTNPLWLKYAEAVGVMAIWKWYYYAPNTLKQLFDSQIKRGETNANFANVENPFNVEAERPATMGVCWRALKNGNPKPTLALLKIMAPYGLYHFVALPAPFFLLGGPAMGTVALMNVVVAEIFTNIHAFVTIVTNHAGEDVYKFDTPVLPKTDEFFLRAVIGSANYRTAYTTPGRPEGKPAGWLGEANDFMHGWLNYQIEHHMFPDLSMLSYQKAMPRVKEACERYGIPYVQESVWVRLIKTFDVMVGATTMKSWEKGE